MAYVYTWDTTAPLITDLVRDGAAEIREQVKGALNERLLTVFTNMTADPLVHAKVLVAATGKVNLDGLAAGDTYILEGFANAMELYAGGVEALRVQSTLVSAFVDFTVSATKKVFMDGGGDTYIQETVANRIGFIAGGSDVLGLTSTLVTINGVDLLIAATKKFRVDGSSSGDTYITETSANQLDFVAGGFTNIRFNSGDTILGSGTKKIGFYGNNGAVQPTVINSRGGNAALASLLTGLAGLSLLIDNSTA